jgi:PAS domain S-box-containing protein
MTRRDIENGADALSAASRGLGPKAASLSERESLGMLLFEMTAQGVVYQDAAGVLSANPAAQRMLGLGSDQSQDHPTIDPGWRFVHEDGSRFPQDEHPGMLALRTGKEVRDVVVGVMNPQGSTYSWLNVTAKPLFRPGEPTPHRSLVFLDDITERRRTEAELRASREEMRSLFDLLPVGVSILDEHQALKTFNPALGAILGLTSDALRDGAYRQRRYLRSDGTPMPEEEFPSVRAQREQRTISGVAVGVVKEDGSTGWTEVSAAPLFLPHVSCVTVTTDITEKKRTAEALHQSEQTVHMLFQSVNDTLLVSELDDQGMPGNFVLVNDTACQRLGYSREELLARTPADISSEDSRSSIGAGIRRALAERRAIVEAEHVTKDGRIIPVEISTNVVTLGTKTVSCSIARDITQRKQAEASYGTLFREMLDGFALQEMICDAEGRPVDYRFLAVNSAFERMTGLKAGALVGRTVLAVLPAIDRHWIETCGNVVLTGEPVFFESYATVLNRTFDVKAFRAAPRQFVCILTDVTERRASEAERVVLQGQLAQAQKMEAVGRLAGGVAHDFNNMLGAILGHVEMAMEEVDSTLSLYADLQEIQTAARRSTELTRQLLAFARKQTVAPKVLDLNQTVEGMLKMLRRLLGEDISLTWKPHTDLWSVKLDPSQLDQILANLCVNARDAIADVGKITIETKNSRFDQEYCVHHAGFVVGDYVLLAVSDNGSGMDKATQVRLFEPFFTTKAPGKGTGLGLATVYGIVKQNGGFINVYSEPGH